MRAAQPVRRLAAEIDAYLAGLEAGCPPVSEVRAGFADACRHDLRPVTANPEPSCGGLAAAIAAVHNATPLREAIEGSLPYLDWITYDSYPREAIGERFPQAHAFTSIAGTGGFYDADDFELGLFLILPRTLYRDHRHLAPELYAPLTGPHDWRFGPHDSWKTQPAHQPVWNEPDRVHAVRVGETPFLCIYGWTKDVGAIAELVPAGDWADIEAQL